MAGVSIDTLGMLMTEYIPGVTETLNNEVLLRRKARDDYKWEGDKIEFHVHTARNIGLGYVEDGGALPVANKQDYVKAEAYRKFLVGSVQATDGALATAATSKRAARDTATSELRGMMEGMAKYENFMGYRDGTGTVGLVGTDVSGTTWGATDARLIWDKQTYEIRDADAIGTQHGTVTISSVARALDTNDQFAVTSTAALPAAAAATDFIVWPNAVNRAITGLQSMINDSGTFQNINTTTYPRYTSPIISNGGTAQSLDPTLFRQMLAMIVQESGKAPGRSISVLTNIWESIETEELYESELRITPDTKTGGMAIAKFQSSLGTIEIEPDADAPYGEMFFVDFSQIYRAVQKELDWRRDGKGGGIFKRSDQSTVYRASAIEICEYFIKQRNRCGRIKDLSETVTTAY